MGIIKYEALFLGNKMGIAGIHFFLERRKGNRSTWLRYWDCWNRVLGAAEIMELWLDSVESFGGDMRGAKTERPRG